MVGMLIVRPVTPEDLDLICRHRLEMFKASGRTDEMVAPMAAPFRAWLEPRLVGGRYFGWIIEDQQRPIAGVGMMVIDWPPHPSHMTQDCRGYILNMFVEPGHRRRGLGKRLWNSSERRPLVVACNFSFCMPPHRAVLSTNSSGGDRPRRCRIRLHRWKAPMAERSFRRFR